MTSRAPFGVATLSLLLILLITPRTLSQASHSSVPLRLGLPASATVADRDAATRLEGLLEGLSVGAIDVEPVPAPCHGPSGCLPALQAGDLDIAAVTTGQLTPLFPELRVLGLPYLFASSVVVERVLDGTFATRLSDAVVGRTGLRPLAITVRGWRGFATAGSTIRGPRDLEGLSIATGTAPGEAALVEALRGSPVPVSLVSRAEALGAGVDGASVTLTDLLDRRLFEPFGSFTVDDHSVVLTWWLVNEETLRGLPARLRPRLDAAFDEVAGLHRGESRSHRADIRRRFESLGGRVHVTTPEERTALLMATGRVALEYMDDHGPDWLVWLEAAIAQAEAEITDLVEARGLPRR